MVVLRVDAVVLRVDAVRAGAAPVPGQPVILDELH